MFYSSMWKLIQCSRHLQFSCPTCSTTWKRAWLLSYAYHQEHIHVYEHCVALICSTHMLLIQYTYLLRMGHLQRFCDMIFTDKRSRIENLCWGILFHDLIFSWFGSQLWKFGSLEISSQTILYCTVHVCELKLGPFSLHTHFFFYFLCVATIPTHTHTHTHTHTQLNLYSNFVNLCWSWFIVFRLTTILRVMSKLSCRPCSHCSKQRMKKMFSCVWESSSIFTSSSDHPSPLM